jgi:butyryl-CoA dehydrogenase
MLLAQKAYAEGAYALCLLGTQLADDARTAPSEEERKHADTLLDFLTPMIKSWPSENGPRANSLAIQVLGGAGYTNDHPVEMFYRDNRLNPIHEGTTGIQSMDLLARKVPMHNMAGYHALLAEMQKTIDSATENEQLAVYAGELQQAIATLRSTTDALLAGMMTVNIDLALSNSVKYLELFGNVVIAWLWLKQGIVASSALAQQPDQSDENFYRGKLQAMRYFFRFELPEIDAWAKLLSELDSTCYDMQPDWF